MMIHLGINRRIPQWDSRVCFERLVNLHRDPTMIDWRRTRVVASLVD